ncbi:MAG: molybdopterin biosynthesis protein [Dehalococcoidia bacterium]|nr:molybdopterin biosynthesis protein [Dehalococcoidia bacterium]
MPELFTVVPPDEALKRLFSHIRPGVGTQNVKVNLALGRITAEDTFAPADLPAFSRSTMDGYAVKAADTYGASEAIPAYLKVVGEIPMGKPAGLTLRRGQVAKVHTGGMLAEGADAVVMVENTQVVDETTIEVVRPVAPGENVLHVGDDVKKGHLLLSARHLLRPQDIGGLMGLGITEIAVSSRPRVAILSTGDELVPPDGEVTPGKVRDINTYSLSALTLQAGAIPLSFGLVGDSYDELREAAVRGMEQADMLVISAGSSVSTRDLTAQVISSLGKPGVLVHGVSIRPGKPTILASVEGKPAIGLPGNPVSALVIFDLFVVPTIYRLAGCTTPPLRPSVEARLTHNLASVTGREDYVPVKLETNPEGLLAVPIFGESNLISTMMRADGMARVPLDKGGLSAGETVTVRLF